MNTTFSKACVVERVFFEGCKQYFLVSPPPVSVDYKFILCHVCQLNRLSINLSICPSTKCVSAIPPKLLNFGILIIGNVKIMHDENYTAICQISQCLQISTVGYIYTLNCNN